jgi:hypothetical protein
MKIVARPVEMVAWFTQEGIPKPVRFRLINEEGTYTIIKIDRIVSKDREKLAGNEMLIFTCESMIKGIQKIYEIKYELRSCKWILYKM